MSKDTANANVRPVALVTGGAVRVGAGIALELARAGYDIAIHYRNSDAAADRTKGDVEAIGREAMTVCGDLLDPDAPANIVCSVREVFGRLDVLVNNASLFEPDPPGAFSHDHWQRMMQVNAFAPTALIESAKEMLVRSGQGKVINLCDISADRPWPSHAAYCASKSALANITQSYARRLAPDILVNGIAPGIAIFPEYYDAELREHLVKKVPLKRAGGVGDIASTAGFLVEHGHYITGQILRVDGGRSIV